MPGYFFAGELLVLLDTTQDMLPLSTQYLSSYSWACPFWPFTTHIPPRSARWEDSRAPFLSVLVSSLVNIALDILLVAIIPWGVRGAAIATVFSQAAMAVFIIAYAAKVHPELRFVRPVKADLPLLKKGMLYGVPPCCNRA